MRKKKGEVQNEENKVEKKSSKLKEILLNIPVLLVLGWLIGGINNNKTFVNIFHFSFNFKIQLCIFYMARKQN
jgi:hypothetical protein